MSQKLTYTRDATDRVTQQVGSGTSGVADTSTQLYGFIDSTDSPEYQLTTAKALAERYLALPGGVLLTRRYASSGADTWSLPNLHGDVTCTNNAGAITSSGTIYDPYGQPLDATAGTVKTTATPTTRSGPTTDAWEGSHQRGYQHTLQASTKPLWARACTSQCSAFSRVLTPSGVAPQMIMPTRAIPSTLRIQTAVFNFRKWFKRAVAAIGVISAAACIVASAGACAVGLGLGLLASVGNDAWGAARHEMTWKQFGFNTAFNVGTYSIPGVRVGRVGKLAGKEAAGIGRHFKEETKVTMALRATWSESTRRSAARTAAYVYGGYHSATGKWLW